MIVYRISNYTIFGGTITSKAIDNFGVGTNELAQLQQDYELRFTGVLDTMILGDGRTYIYVASGGQMATIFRMSGRRLYGSTHWNPLAVLLSPFQLLNTI